MFAYTGPHKSRKEEPENMRGLGVEERVLVAHLDVLGMSRLIGRSTGEAWDLLLDLAEATESSELPLTTDTRASLTERYFSDTILIRTQSDNIESLHAITARSLEIFCNALRAGIPLRGGIAHGSWIESEKGDRDIFTGQALLYAHDIGEAQQMLGIALCAKSSARFATHPFSFSNGLSAVFEYDVPEKRGTCLRAVIDWPAICRLEPTTMPHGSGREVANLFTTMGCYDSLDERARRKYDNTASFIAASVRRKT